MTTSEDPADIVTAIDAWGRLQAAHGDAARLAHEDPGNDALGAAAVALEAEHTAARYAWGAALNAAVAETGAPEAQHRALCEVIDGWGFGLWHAAWHAALGGAVDGGGLAEWRAREVEPQREVWEPAVRAIIGHGRHAGVEGHSGAVTRPDTP